MVVGSCSGRPRPPRLSCLRSQARRGLRRGQTSLPKFAGRLFFIRNRLRRLPRQSVRRENSCRPPVCAPSGAAQAIRRPRNRDETELSQRYDRGNRFSVASCSRSVIVRIKPVGLNRFAVEIRPHRRSRDSPPASLRRSTPTGSGSFSPGVRGRMVRTKGMFLIVAARCPVCGEPVCLDRSTYQNNYECPLCLSLCLPPFRAH